MSLLEEPVGIHFESEEEVIDRLKNMMHRWNEKAMEEDFEGKFLDMEEKKVAFVARIRDNFPDRYVTYKLYHMIAGSTIHPGREGEVVNFDFPDFGGGDNSYSIQKFIETNYI